MSEKEYNFLSNNIIFIKTAVNNGLSEDLFSYAFIILLLSHHISSLSLAALPKEGKNIMRRVQ